METDLGNLETNLGNLETDLGKKNKGDGFYCDVCKVSISTKYHLEKHYNTNKHKKLINPIEKYECKICNKEFNNRSGLWKHNKKCEEENNAKNETKNGLNDIFKPQLFMEMCKENIEFKKFFMEQMKEIQTKLFEQNIEQQKLIEKLSSQPNSITTNSHNKTFNLQVFLNETCKDALNITDFVNQIKLTADDFEKTGRLGFIDGISDIMIKELKKTKLEHRPIHCTDLKRETIYIKENDAWEKEDQDKEKLKNALKSIANLNLMQFNNWQERNPEYLNLDTKQNNEAIKYSLAALGGYCKEENDKLYDKISKNVVRNVVLDKDKRLETYHLTL